MEAQAIDFLATLCARTTSSFSVKVMPIGGGLESAVARADVSDVSTLQSGIPRRFVIKALRGVQRREAAIYRELWLGLNRPPAARVLGSNCEQDTHYLFLEEVGESSAWPWSNPSIAVESCRVLAELHRSGVPTAGVFSEWNYEAELASSAATTLALATVAKNAEGELYWRRLGDLRRVIAVLPELRRKLLSEDLTLIHGDMHPGNVIVRTQGSVQEVVFIDWARARAGSALEDLASWLHSLGCWEPEARRRHDSLVRAYRRARAMPEMITDDFRRRYWIASASNGLAGAIRYHLSVLGDPASSEVARAHSSRALPAWQRVIRRASALLPPRLPIK